MKLSKDQQVSICLQNNIMLEGKIKFYSDEEVILVSLNGLSEFIIPNPKQVIVFVKIILHPVEDKHITEIKEQISTVLHQAIEEPNEVLREKTVSQLKALVKEQDQKIINYRLKNHQLGQPRIVQYGTPGFFKKPSAQ